MVLRPTLLAPALLTLATLAASAVWNETAAQAGYDDPMMGETPCVVLAHYVTDARLGREPIDPMNLPLRTSSAAVANICGRSVEVELCINYVEPMADDVADCVTTMLRPWSQSAVHEVSAAAHFTGPTWRWRWVSDTTGM